MTKVNTRGFTLIEVMVATAIIAILAAIAYPSYRDSILKGRRAEARTALAELMQQQERYITQRNCYLGFTTTSAGVATASAPSPSTACGGVTATAVPFKTYAGASLASASYVLSADVCPTAVGATTTMSIAECVRVTATPRAPHVDLAAGALRMTSTGFKDCTGTKASVAGFCWQ